METLFIDLEPVGKAVEDTFADFLDAVRQRVTKTVSTTVRSMRRSLADFDRIQRLEGPTSSTTTKTTNAYSGTALELAALAKQLEDTKQALLGVEATAASVGFAPAITAFAGLGTAVTGVTSAIGTGLAGAASSVLGPLKTWAMDAAGTASLQSFSAGLGLVSAGLLPVHSALNATGPLARTAGQSVSALALTTTSAAGTVTAAGEAMSGAAGRMSGSFTAASGTAGAAFGGLTAHLSAMVAASQQSLAGLGTFLTGVFTGNWQEAFTGLGDMVKGGANSVIGFLNAMIAGLVSGLNSLIGLLNRLKINIPDWVPLLGGKSLGFDLKTLTAPQIPYLAQGAVLPANKPFLAVVGDQKHGTNIEAPLSTIQQAVAETVGSANAEAVALLEQLLQAVLSIRVGDEAIASAASRHSARLAVVKGG